jgi:hypothetical protein
MAYIGVTPSNVFGQGTKDSFNGDGSTTAFTLSRSVLLATDIEVFVGNVRQEPSVAYTVSGTTLTFTGTPASGTGNIYAVHQSSLKGTLVPPTGLALTPTTITASGTITATGNITTSGTVEPAGDTAAGDNAAIGFTSTEGLILTGQGSTNDVTIKNDADTEVMGVATGATIVDFASGPTVADVAIKVAGKESIWVPAGAMYPSTTNPCSDLTQVETTALRPDLKVLDFAAAADDFAQFSIAFPKSWNEGTITYQPFWTVTGTNTGTVVWQLGGIAVTSDATINTAFGTLIATTALAHSGTSNDLMVSAESSAVTIAGSPSTDDVCFFQINLDTSASGQSGVVRLLGIKLFFTTDAANDA